MKPYNSHDYHPSPEITQAPTGQSEILSLLNTLGSNSSYPKLDLGNNPFLNLLSGINI